MATPPRKSPPLSRTPSSKRYRRRFRAIRCASALRHAMISRKRFHFFAPRTSASSSSSGTIVEASVRNARRHSNRLVKVGVITLGCDKNTVDSERYLAQLSDYSAEFTPELGQADLIIVNTCGFIDAAKKESIDAMIEAARFKTEGRCRAVIAVDCIIER